MHFVLKILCIYAKYVWVVFVLIFASVLKQLKHLHGLPPGVTFIYIIKMYLVVLSLNFLKS